jgi:hypothetical protein
LALKKACPGAVFFDTIDSMDDDGEATDSAEEEEECETYPQTLTSFYDDEFSGDLEKHCSDIYKNYSCTELQVANLELKTKSQSVCPMWFEHRKGRITGTKVHSVVHRRSSTKPDNLVRRIVGYESYDLSKLKSVKWGVDNESVARKAYADIECKKHSSFQCDEVGFLIDRHDPFLGVSSDGLVACQCCGRGIIEIKCPHKHANDDLKTAGATDRQFMLDSNLKLKTSHQYYTQVQIGMHVHRVEYCDFIVWTTREVHIQRIIIDPEFCHSAVKVCKDFFSLHVLPELVTRKLEGQCSGDATQPPSSGDATQPEFWRCNPAPEFW